MNRLTVFKEPSLQVIEDVKNTLLLSTDGYKIESFNEFYFDEHFQIRFEGLENSLLFTNLRNLLYPQGIDFIIQEPQLPLKLFCFDMDSTTLSIETMDEFAGSELGDEMKKQIEYITSLGMEGKIDYMESFKKRHALLNGLEVKKLEDFYAREIKDKKFNKGIKEFLASIKQAGGTSVLLSGGFVQFANLVATDLGFDHVFASEPEVSNGRFTGFIEEDKIFTAEKKKAKLLHYTSKLNLDKAQVFATGDGSNDIEMFKNSGLAVAYRAKKIVKESTSNWLEFASFKELVNIID